MIMLHQNGYTYIRVIIMHFPLWKSDFSLCKMGVISVYVVLISSVFVFIEGSPAIQIIQNATDWDMAKQNCMQMYNGSLLSENEVKMTTNLSSPTPYWIDGKEYNFGCRNNSCSSYTIEKTNGTNPYICDNGTHPVISTTNCASFYNITTSNIQAVREADGFDLGQSYTIGVFSASVATKCKLYTVGQSMPSFVDCGESHQYICIADDSKSYLSTLIASNTTRESEPETTTVPMETATTTINNMTKSPGNMTTESSTTTSLSNSSSTKMSTATITENTTMITTMKTMVTTMTTMTEQSSGQITTATPMMTTTPTTTTTTTPTTTTIATQPQTASNSTGIAIAIAIILLLIIIIIIVVVYKVRKRKSFKLNENGGDEELGNVNKAAELEPNGGYNMDSNNEASPGLVEVDLDANNTVYTGNEKEGTNVPPENSNEDSPLLKSEEKGEIKEDAGNNTENESPKTSNDQTDNLEEKQNLEESEKPEKSEEKIKDESREEAPFQNLTKESEDDGLKDTANNDEDANNSAAEAKIEDNDPTMLEEKSTEPSILKDDSLEPEVLKEDKSSEPVVLQDDTQSSSDQPSKPALED